MAQLAIKTFDDAPAAIDRTHLSRMTFGDAGLERELLQLFDRQAELLLARMRTGDAKAVGTLAHTLKGSALGVGAQPVAAAAEAVEQAAAMPGREDAIERLAAEIGTVRGEIAAILSG
jgi:HPt (histidine-containing phosphotransfer) domain-containing protein